MLRNPHFDQLTENYLFAEIQNRKKRYLLTHREASIINLGIGDTQLPLPKVASKAMEKMAEGLATPQGYRGYGSEQGDLLLREQISQTVYKGSISPDEIFIGDGVKCDIARLQVLLGADARIGLQDPTYPAYSDSAILTSGLKNRDQLRLKLFSCTAENGYFPKLEDSDPKIDLLFFCSPNNPTGCAATKEQLKDLVDWAIQYRVVIAFDAAYSWYIRDEKVPLSIFEIEGAERCALEFNSFSKMAGFTGVRLSWTALPSTLKYWDQKNKRFNRTLLQDWKRLYATLFNGASNVAQAGGLACLSQEGLMQVRSCTDYYMENAHFLRKALQKVGVQVVGGQDAPYLWVFFEGATSWQTFDRLLKEKQIICTPGVGFGAQGEGFVRFSSLGLREEIAEAARRLSLC